MSLILTVLYVDKILNQNWILLLIYSEIIRNIKNLCDLIQRIRDINMESKVIVRLDIKSL